MKITWLKGGLSIPHIGMAKLGKTADVPEPDAHSLVKQGIAKYASKSIKTETKAKKGVI